MSSPSIKRAIALCLLCLPSTAVLAATGQALEGCTDLSGAQTVTRFGNQLVLVRDGETFYRLNADDCDRLSMATRLQVQTEGKAGRLCAAGTQVETNTGACRIASVERIDQRVYDRYQRRR